MQDDIVDLFSADYATARQRWLALAAARGLAVRSYLHPLRGPQGETLAMDVVLDGPVGASKVLLLTGGVHGVEGHLGCGIQAGLLRLGATLREPADADTLIVHVHAPSTPTASPMYGASRTRTST